MTKLTQSELNAISSIGIDKIALDLGSIIGCYAGGSDEQITEWIGKIEDALNEML